MKQLYLHKGQFIYRQISANSSVNICGRRWGKAHLVAMDIMTAVTEMPGSTGVFVASSFRQAHSRTLPAALEALANFGWIRDIHYVIGHKPDPKLGYAKPFFMPSDLKDVVWFANGTIMVIVSQEVVLSANSMTIHWLIGDEAKGLDQDKLESEIFPAVGGSSRYFSDPAKFCHLWGIHFYTDMPNTKDGLWLIKKYEQYKDEDLYRTIIMLERHREKMLQNNYRSQELNAVTRKLNLLRNKCFLYQERSSFDNIAVIGADYITRCARDLPPMVFRASILCKRITEAEGKFYQNFALNLHTYTANNNDKLNNYQPQQYDSSFDNDVNPNKPIAIAFDYNAQITCLVASQVNGSKHQTIKSFYTKYNERLRECIQHFCAYYRGHHDKTVIYYHDSTALSVNYVEVNHDARYYVHDEFNKHGWRVIDKYLGNPMAHDRKHLIINNALAGQEKLFPMFNADNNVELIQAIPLTGIRIGEKGFKKDKTQEKDLESESNLPYELRTDITDAWDTNFLGCLTMPYDDDSFIYA